MNVNILDLQTAQLYLQTTGRKKAIMYRHGAPSIFFYPNMERSISSHSDACGILCDVAYIGCPFVG